MVRKDLQRLLMGHSPKLQTILDAARKRFREGKGISHEAFWKEVDSQNAGNKKQGSARKNGRIKRST
jgi:hypothetical protein